MNQGEQSRAGKSEQEVILPWDLSDWFDPAQLLSWVEKEVDTLHWDNPTLQQQLKAHPDYRPRMLLCLLTWAYGTALFESGEIVDACDTDPGLKRLCQSQPPSDKALTRFRRDNRGLLKWSLTQLLRRALRSKWDLDETWFPPGMKRYLTESASFRLDLARQVDRGSSGY